MTGLSRQTSRWTEHFCILNRYKARSKYVFCKQTADLFYKKFEIFWIFHLILCVQVCAGVRRSARVCAGAPGYAQVCAGVLGCAQVCMGVRGYARVCTGVRLGARRCVQVCVDMHGCGHVCGMNFQNFLWRIESIRCRPRCSPKKCSPPNAPLYLFNSSTYPFKFEFAT